MTAVGITTIITTAIISNGIVHEPAIPQDLVGRLHFWHVSGFYFWVYGNLVVLS
jgi:hypothetical protein